MRKDFRFYEGKLTSGKIQLILFRINSILILLNKIIESENKSFIENKFLKSGKEDSMILAENISKIKGSLVEKYLYFLEGLNMIGIGEYKLKIASTKKIVILLENPTITLSYTNLFKKKPKVDIVKIAEGYLKYFTEGLLKREAKVITKKTLRNHYMFLIQIKEKKSIKKVKINYPKPKLIMEMNPFIKKVLLNNLLTFEGGKLKLYGIPAITFPYFLMLNLLKDLDNEKYFEFFKSFGSVLGQVTYKTQEKNFGLNKDKILNQAFQQAELIGAGKIKEDGQGYKIQNNLKYYQDLGYDTTLLETFFKYILYGLIISSKKKKIIINNSEEEFVQYQKSKESKNREKELISFF